VSLVQWRSVEVGGRMLQGEFVGTISGEPDIELHANRYTWEVRILGIQAILCYIQPHDVERASRRQQRKVEALMLAKSRAESWTAKVLASRDKRDQYGLS